MRFNQLTPEQREEVLKRTMHGSALASNTKLSDFPFQCSCYADDPLSVDLAATPEFFADGPFAVDVNSENVPVIGSVHSLESFSSNDGPGIRALLFLQGCAKRCLFCSNPETQCIVDPYQCPEMAVSDVAVESLLKR